MNRLKEKYLNEVVPSLKEKHNYNSIRKDSNQHGCW